MKKKKLSLKSLEVKSFITNLEGPISKTIKGGESDNEACLPGSPEMPYSYSCIDPFSLNFYCKANSICSACETGYSAATDCPDVGG